MGARQNAHHFAGTGINTNIGSNRIHDIDAIGFLELPRTRGKRVRLGSQCPDRAKVNQVARQFGVDRRFDIRSDFGVLATVDSTHGTDTGDFFGEANATGAVNATGHDRFDDRAQFLVLHGTFFLGVT